MLTCPDYFIWGCLVIGDSSLWRCCGSLVLDAKWIDGVFRRALAFLDVVELEIGMETWALRGAHGCAGSPLDMTNCYDDQDGACTRLNVPACSRDKLVVE